MQGTARLPTKCPLMVADVDARNLVSVSLDLVAVRSVPNDFLRGLDEEMVAAVVEVYDDCGGVLFRLDCFQLRFVARRCFPPACILAPLNIEARDAVCLVRYGFPMRAVTFPHPTLLIAVEVTHFVQEAVAVLLLRPVPKQGDFDADTTLRPPIELTELAAGVRKGKGDFGKLVVKDGSVELVKPSLQLFRCDFHTFVGLVTLYYMRKPCQKSDAGYRKGDRVFYLPPPVERVVCWVLHPNFHHIGQTIGGVSPPHLGYLEPLSREPLMERVKVFVLDASEG